MENIFIINYFTDFTYLFSENTLNYVGKNFCGITVVNNIIFCAIASVVYTIVKIIIMKNLKSEFMKTYEDNINPIKISPKPTDYMKWLGPPS